MASKVEIAIDEGIEYIKKIVEAVTGRKDVRSRVAVLADPDNKKTGSVLTRSQAEFVKRAYWASSNKKWGSMWDGLRRLADEELEVNISIGGRGREDSIKFVGALSEGKMLQRLGFTVSGERSEG